MYKGDYHTALCLPLLSSIHLGGCHVQDRSPYSIMFAIVVKYSSWWLLCTRMITLQHHVCHCCQVFILAVMNKDDHRTTSCLPLLSSIDLGGCHVLERSPYSIMVAIVVKYSSCWLLCTSKVTLQHHDCHCYQVFILVAVEYKEDDLTTSCLPLLSSIHLGGCHVQGRSPYSIMFAIVDKYSSWGLSCSRQITLQHHVCHCCQVLMLVAVMYKTDHLTSSCLPLLSSIHIDGCHVQGRSPYSLMFAIVGKFSSWWLSCTRKITLQHHVFHCCQVFILVAGMYKTDHLTSSCLQCCQVFILIAVMYKEDHLTVSCLPLLSSIHLGGCHI